MKYGGPVREFNINKRGTARPCTARLREGGHPLDKSAPHCQPEASLETVGERFRSASGQAYDELGRVDDDNGTRINGAPARRCRDRLREPIHRRLGATARRTAEDCGGCLGAGCRALPSCAAGLVQAVRQRGLALARRRGRLRESACAPLDSPCNPSPHSGASACAGTAKLPLIGS